MPKKVRTVPKKRVSPRKTAPPAGQQHSTVPDATPAAGKASPALLRVAFGDDAQARRFRARLSANALRVLDDPSLPTPYAGRDLDGYAEVLRAAELETA